MVKVRRFSLQQEPTLKEYRDKRGLSQEKFGELIDADQSLISKYESGDRRPTLKAALKIETVTNGEIPMKNWARPTRKSRSRA